MVLNADKPREVLAVESLTMELDALVIIRLCEDLLNISRSLKETWVLGTLKVEESTEEVREVDRIFRQFNRLTDAISMKEKKEGV